MWLRPVRFASVLLAVSAAAVMGVRAAHGGDADPHSTFFTAFERGDGKAALAALAPELRDASPYDAKTAALAPFPRDKDIYFALVERFEKKSSVSPAAHREAVLHLAVATIAWREGDFERARRRLLLAVARDPFDRMSHIYLARCYAALETEALKTAGEKSAGEVLIEKVGFASSDMHVDFAEGIVEKLPADVQAVTASFVFDKGAVKDLKTERRAASANARLQRERAGPPRRGDLSVVLLAADRTRLDEAWFAPVQTLSMDGMDEAGKPTHSRTNETTFPVSVELLSPTAAARVLVYDGEGKRIFEGAVAATAAPK